MDISEEILHRFFLLGAAISRRRRRRLHRWWIRPILNNRDTYGTYFHLVRELELSSEEFQTYFRLNKDQFGHVLALSEETLHRQSRTREAISAKQRLAICLRFLATGESYTSLAYSYRVAQPTISKIIPEVCKIIWAKLAPLYLTMPASSEEWQSLSRDFMDKWQFPNCIGAIDGKHIMIKAPNNSGSLYFNYKGTFSIVLLALVDANLQFVMVDIGAFGRNSDGGIFANSNFGVALAADQLNLPRPRVLPGAEQLGPMPYVIVGDEAFPLQEHIMRPYPGRGSTETQEIYNYRLSRARRVVENAFGILATRWRVFYTKIGVAVETTKDIVKATIVLHNLLQRETTGTQNAQFLDNFDEKAVEGYGPLNRMGNRGSRHATEIRNKFKEYFKQVLPVPWQETHVRRGHFGP